ncbi:MAG: DUF1559 domain-containing protein [Planctomycetaceae bacterium]|nr:DUF1559 domain-containing protein [Planctomycetaceae bacterium]
MHGKHQRARRFGGRDHPARRRGVTLVEVIVVVVILTLLALVAATALPRGRETARLAACQDHLRQIGIALVLYDQMAGHLPMVPEGARRDRPASSDGPLKVLLETLGLPDLTEVSDAKGLPRARPGLPSGERPARGFVCPSDPNVMAGLFPAPVSYRATTGDSPTGINGAFAPGRLVSLAEVEAGDGKGYTAGFAERLVGNSLKAPALENYAVAPGPLGDAGCPRPDPSAWRGDAGASWVASNWQSTLYNHALTPDQFPSCLAADHRSAFMGASSRHTAGLNVLILDGSVRTFTSKVDPRIWRALATTNSATSPPARPTEP